MEKLLLLFVVMISFTAKVSAQNFALGTFDEGPPTIDTYAETQSGKTKQGYISFTISNIPGGTNMSAGWTFKIRANGAFVSGANSIPSQYISLKFRSVSSGPAGVSGAVVPLTSIDANLITTSTALMAPNDWYVAQKFDMIIQGGNHLLSMAGTYSTTLTLSLYDNMGTLVSTNSNIPISFVLNFSNTCSGATVEVSTSTVYNFDTYAKTQTGATVPEALDVQYRPNGASCVGWSLKVRANGDFVNGQSSIPAQYVSLRFNRVSEGSPSAAAIGIPNTPVPLSLTDANLVTQSNAPFQVYTVHKFDVIIQGGAHLQMGATGNYTCPLTFTLYNQNGQLISSFVKNLTFQIYFSSSFNYTVTIQDPDVSLDYSIPSAFANGVSVTKTDGLRITGYSAHQVIVKTTTADLTSGSNTIPVSVVNLQVIPPAGKPGIATTTRSLSTSDQVIITNAMLNDTYHTVDYSLRYYTNGGNSLINAAGTGTYTTQVLYIVLPQ